MAPMQIEAKLPQRAEISERGFAKARLRRPEIDAAKKLVGNDFGIGGRQIETDIEGFLEVGLREIETFTGDTDIAAIVSRPRDRQFVFRGSRCRKEGLRAPEYAQRWRSSDTPCCRT